MQAERLLSGNVIRSSSSLVIIMLSYAVGNLRINGLATKREKPASKREERIICCRFQN